MYIIDCPVSAADQTSTHPSAGVVAAVDAHRIDDLVDDSLSLALVDRFEEGDGECAKPSIEA